MDQKSEPHRWVFDFEPLGVAFCCLGIIKIDPLVWERKSKVESRDRFLGQTFLFEIIPLELRILPRASVLSAPIRARAPESAASQRSIGLRQQKISDNLAQKEKHFAHIPASG